ncbi:MAG: hypothetical protein ACR2KV_07855 [Solirubrobacteraceae bacterium]
MGTEAVRAAAAAGPTAAVTLVAVSYSTPPAAVDLDAVEVAVVTGEGPPATG